MDKYLDVNRANWDARAVVHVGSGGYDLGRTADQTWQSKVVQFDRPLLGDLAGRAWRGRGGP